MMRGKNVFWGIIFIAGAVLLLVGKTGILGDISVGTILFSVLFAAALISSLMHRNVPGMLFSAAFLSIIYAKPLGITALTPWPVLGAALLASIGAGILYHPKKYFWKEYNHWNNDAVIETLNENDMEFITSFGESIKYIISSDLKKVRADCSFGNMKLYFDQAVITGDQAVIEIRASFCGVELFLPKEWQIVNHLDTSFGGVDEKNRSDSNGKPLILLVGTVSFAGVTILYV